MRRRRFLPLLGYPKGGRTPPKSCAGGSRAHNPFALGSFLLALGGSKKGGNYRERMRIEGKSEGLCVLGFISLQCEWEVCPHIVERVLWPR